MKILMYLFDFIVPRFITEDVALIKIEFDDSEEFVYLPLCSMRYIEDETGYDAVVKMKSFSWLGRAWFPQPLEAPREV